MNFNSIPFLFFFLALLLAYRLIPDRHKWKLILVFSLLFYACSGWEKLLFVLGTSVVVYGAAGKMGSVYQEYEKRCREEALSPGERGKLLPEYKRRCRRILTAVLFVCVGILIYCKFAGKLIYAITDAVGTPKSVSIIVPLGISYYTFSSVGYLLDIYWRKIRPEPAFSKILLCMTYFPHIVQGPISRYNRLLSQLPDLSFPDYERLCMGLQLMLWGYFKKMVVADRLNLFINDVFGDIGSNEGLIFVIVLIFCVFQLYADFSGCMDIVTGISDILGIQLDRNFNHPFFSRSAAEFWRRWHITLGTWFKDYIYLPMATAPGTIRFSQIVKNRFGSRAGKNAATVLCLGTVWLLTGIWHGTGWNYVIWGLYFGVLISCSTVFADQYKKLCLLFRIDTESGCWKAVQVLRTFCLFAIGRLITAPETLKDSAAVVQQMFSSFNPWIFWDGSLYTHGLNQRNFLLAVLSILLLLYVDRLQERIKIRETIARQNIFLRWSIYYIGIFAVLILGIYGPGYDASSFVYANF